MSRLEIILSAILFVSVVLNVGIFIYARAAIARLLFVSEELSDLQQMINSFAGHLKSVYEMDSFYGDQTLRGLLNHAICFNDQLGTFEMIYSLLENQEQEIQIDYEAEQPTEEKKTQ